jgi:hypothetical protein
VKESQFQSRLIKKLKEMFPGCVVLKNDPGYLQGFPDLTVFYKNRWAALECKCSSKSSHQPNQDYYVSYLNDMSFARFISPENEEEVLHDLQSTFGS